MNLRSLGLLVLLLAPSNCFRSVGVTMTYPHRIARDYPAPTAAELLAIVQARLATTTDIAMHASLRIREKDVIRDNTVEILAMRDGRLWWNERSEGSTAGLSLVVLGDALALSDHAKNLQMRGPACASNLGSLLGIPLLPKDLSAILLGDVPRALDPSSVRVDWDELLGLDILVMPGPEGSTLWLGFRHRKVEDQGAESPRLDWDLVFLRGSTKARDAIWTMDYRQRDFGDPVVIPQRIAIAEPGKPLNPTIQFEINAYAQNFHFDHSLEAPAQYRVVQIGCE